MKIGYHFVSADVVAGADNNWLEQQSEIARIKMKQAESGEFLLVIDEIQKIDNWSETVKLLWDTDAKT
jgi:predicted AAA+ superfamily ATPase